MNGFLMYVKTQKLQLLAYLFAAVLGVVSLLFPQVAQLVAWGAVLLIGSVFHQGDALALVGIFVVLVGVLVLVSGVLVYWMAGVRNSMLALALGLSVNYIVITWLMVVVDTSLLYEVAGGLILSYLIFFISAMAVSKMKLHIVVVAIISAALVGGSFYAGSYIIGFAIDQKVDAEENAQFTKVARALHFTAYYPSYNSPSLPASPATLNGYDKDLGDVQNVTFLLGRARVKEGALLDGQDKLINLKDNCDIYPLWSTMDEESSIDDSSIRQSLKHPSACNLMDVTPSGKRVYFDDDSGQRKYFYVRVGDTNFMIEFEEIDQPYDPALKSEYLKVIDSLQPMDNAKLQKGAHSGFGFPY